MATKDEIIRGLEVLITESRRLSTDLTDAQWNTVVDIDGWKNKQVLAHIAGIGGIVVPMVSGLVADADAMAAIDIDALNAGIVDARASASATDLADEIEKAYRGVIDFVANSSEETLAKHATAGGHKDIPISDLAMRMIVLHGMGHIYSVYASIFNATT